MLQAFFIPGIKNDCLFDDTLLDNKVHLNTKLSLLVYALSKLKYFANIYLNHAGGGKVIGIASAICSKLATKTNAFKKEAIAGKRYKKISFKFY